MSTRDCHIHSNSISFPASVGFSQVQMYFALGESQRCPCIEDIGFWYAYSAHVWNTTCFLSLEWSLVREEENLTCSKVMALSFMELWQIWALWRRTRKLFQTQSVPNTVTYTCVKYWTGRLRLNWKQVYTECTCMDTYTYIYCDRPMVQGRWEPEFTIRWVGRG